VGIVPHLGRELAYRQVPKNLADQPFLPTAEEGKVRHLPLGDGVKGTIHTPDGGSDGDHPAAVDCGKALFDQRPPQGGPRVTPILFFDNRWCQPRGRERVRENNVFDVFFGAQNGARPLSFKTARHGGRSVRSVGRSHSASRGGEAGKMKRPHPRVG